MTPIHHYYHVYADAAWEEPVREHLAALTESGLSKWSDLSLNVGIIGAPENVERVLAHLGQRDLAWRCVGSAEQGWEQLTLSALWSDSKSRDGIALYGHTKGAHDTNSFNQAWRRRMTYFTVVRWREALAALEHYDAYGCHWINLEGSWIFGGNFWWTHMKHLRHLDPPSLENRWKAEEWVGHLRERVGDFKVLDPAPGFPGKIQRG